MEESDISDLLFLPSGKILSSTDRGELLVWDGGFVKCVLQMPGKKKIRINLIPLSRIILLKKSKSQSNKDTCYK